MRSRSQYIITKDQVHSYANYWLGAALKLEYRGTKCNARTVLQILLIAAARTVSIFAACRDLADAPCDQTIRNALAASLPDIAELERRLNLSLRTNLPPALFRKSRRIAIDLTLIPYHGRPHQDEQEIYRSAPKSGTTHFHAYATAAVVHKGHRYTLALLFVEKGTTMKEVVKRLVNIVRSRGVKIRFLLLDKGFSSVEVITYLKRAGVGFLIPALVRGRKPRGRKPATGLRALRTKHNGYYQHTLTGQAGGKPRSVRGHDLCGEQKLYAQENGPASHEEVAVRGVESAAHAARDSRDVPHAVWHRDQLSSAAPGADQDLHARPTAAAVVCGDRVGAPQRVGLAALQAGHWKIERRATTLSAAAPFPRNATLDRPSRRAVLRRRSKTRHRI